MPWSATAAREALEGSAATESQSCSSAQPKRGRPSASPRRSYGSVGQARRATPCRWGRRGPSPRRRPCPGSPEWAGNEDSTSPGTATTSHSRPLAACTVITCTASGRASIQPRSSPRSSSTAASSQARKPPSVGRSALAAKVAATSAKASRWARAAPGDQPGPGEHLDVEPEGRLGLARPARPARGRSATAVAARSRRGRAAARARSGRCAGPPPPPRWPAGGRRAPRRCSRCSLASGARSAPRSRRPARCRARAHAPSPSRSAAPRRQDGPVSRRISRSPRVGSCTTRSRATRSATSGVWSSPPRPTTS